MKSMGCNPARKLLAQTGMLRSAIAGLVIMASSCGGMPEFDRAAFMGEPAQAEGTSEALAPLTIVSIDVGQGDSTLVVAPSGEAALIDAGPPGAGESEILPLLSSVGVARLEHLFITHYHEDHYGGAPELMHLLASGGAVYDRGEPVRDPEGAQYDLYERAAAGRRLAVHPGQRIDLGDADLEILAAGGILPDGTQIGLGEPPDENAASVALLIEYAGFRMLVAADITGGGGTPPYETPDVETLLAPFAGDVDVLRVAHHGSKTGTNAAFLAETRPEVAIISVGDENDYGHPHDEVIERLEGAGAEVYMTQRGWLGVPGPHVGGDIRIEVSRDGSYEVR